MSYLHRYHHQIFEYLMLKKPILGICGENSPSYRILKEYGFNTIGYSKEDIKNSIRETIKSKTINSTYELMDWGKAI